MNRDIAKLVLDLCVRCPFEYPQLRCPLASLRKKPFSAIESEISSMARAQLDAIMDYHNECVRVRLSLMTEPRQCSVG